MVDLTKFKSLEEITGESAVHEAIRRSHERWREEHPMVRDLTHTELIETDDRVVVAKRATDAVMKPAIDAARAKELATARGFEWKDGHEDRVVPYFASDERVDRHTDIVEQSWKFDDFEANPVMLFAHNWGAPSIGGVIDWSVGKRESKSYTGDALTLVALYADAETYGWADTIFRLTKAGFMRSGSVGFFPEKVIEVKDKSERRKLGLGDSGLIFRDNRLVEWSPCTIPANPGAQDQLRRAKSLGLVRPTDIAAIREMARGQYLAKPDAWVDADKTIRGIWRVLYPEVKVEPHEDIEEPIAPPEPEEEEDEQEDLVEQVRSLHTKVTSMERTLEDVRELLEYQRRDDDSEHEDPDAEPDPAAVISRAASMALSDT
jgi:hypothetical protein